MILRVSIVFTLVLLIACGSTKNTTKLEQLPNWVKAKPIIDGYYVGLGSAQKTVNVSDYQASAKNNALADMATEISIKVSSQSILNRFENSAGYADDFSSSTKLSTKENLEGYELSKNFESETHYYVLYKLSKQKYEAIQAKKRADAIVKGSDFLNKAKTNYERNEVFQSLISYLKGMQAIKPYFNETLQYESGNGSGDLGNDLFDGFLNTLNSITVEPKLHEINATKGQAIAADMLEFAFKTTKGNAINGLPVIFSLGNRPIRNNKAKTGLNGKVNYSFKNTAIKTGSVYFNATIDATTIAIQGTNDPLLRRMIRKMDMPKGRTLIKVENPSFFVISNEFNLDAELKPKVIEKKMQQLLTNNDYPIVYDKEKANYIIELNTNTTKSSKEGRMCTSELVGDIKVFNSSKQLILHRDIANVKGVQLNYSDAGIDAYSNLTKYLNRNFLPKLKEAVR